MNRRLICFIALLSFALPLAAQTKHLVSRIDVRGNVPAAIVTSQSALTAGQSYSDRDLEIAMGRLRRLPFVFDARYSMEGDTLVIEVDAVSRFFADVDAMGLGQDNNETGTANLAGGARLFLGSGGVVQGFLRERVVENDDLTSIDAEYSHYGIAGTRLFATAGLDYRFLNDEGYDPDPTWRLTVGYPLTVRQTLTASALDEGFERRRNVPISPRTMVSFGNRQTFGLRWTWDTSEDPFFARTGEVISAGPTWTDEESQFEGLIIVVPDGPITIGRLRGESSSTTLDLEAKKYWATGSRGAIFGGLQAARSSFENTTEQLDFPTFHNEADSTAYGVTLGYAHNLFDWSARPGARQRLELSVNHSRSQFEGTFGDSPTFDSTVLTAGYVYRKNFANIRLAVSYRFDDLPTAQSPGSPLR